MRSGTCYSLYSIDSWTKQRLASEATSQKILSAQSNKNDFELDVDGGVLGPHKASIAGPGPELLDFHENLGKKIAKTFAGGSEELRPTRASYIYYESDDYAFFHHDRINAHITIILGLGGELEPLVMLPNFGKVSDEDIKVLNSINSPGSSNFLSEFSHHFGERATTKLIDFSPYEAVAIRGRSTAHGRMKQRAPGVICAICYAFVSPSPDWIAS
ncbi:MAG: hypothetical protein AAGC95_16240 [Pseudomonadota bacterium]